ncbi:MAG: PSD1 and planctomycete cytochrome C domain-containing protein [Verrucomicrobiota bacterium]
MRPEPRLCLSLAIGLLIPTLASAKTNPTPKDSGPKYHEMLPSEHPALAVLEAHCVSCHNPEKEKGGLLIHTAEALARGGDTGDAVIAGNADDSELLYRILLAHDDSEAMPPDGRRLNDAEKAAIRHWISQGAKFPKGRELHERIEEDLATKTSPADAKNLVEIQVYPKKISLETKDDSQRLVVVAKYADDTTRDVTQSATYSITNPSLVNRDLNEFTPARDGKGTIKVSFHGKSQQIPLNVEKAAIDRMISFNLDVMPIFTSAGCNSGGCHGAARGQDGFNLSLFGYDPDGDHFRITREFASRRINLALPEESLMLTKAVESVPHTGGKLFDRRSQYYQTIHDWLKAGAPNDKPDIAKPISLEIHPPLVVLEGVGTKQRFTALAKYSDGTDRDVTDLAIFESNNSPSAAIDKHGIVTSGQRGEAFITARFATFTVGSQAIVIPENLKYSRPDFPANNYIDKPIADKLHKLRIVPSKLASDETFLRRATIDITGKLPTEEEVHTFASSNDPKKREKLVDDLINRKEFTEVWVMKWAELLQIRTINQQNRMSYKASVLYFNWLKERIADNVPFNEIVKELIASEGGTFGNPATNYYQVEQDVLKIAENSAQTFMGMRMQCAQCHNHPFDRWTMDDYYGYAAFFAQVSRKNGADPRERVIFDRGSGETKHPVGNRNMKPRFLGAHEPELKPGDDRRRVLAEWLASPDNPYFARNLANMIWAHFFGRGIVDPVDDVRVSNPASNPELLDALAAKLTEYNYDFKRLVRDIATSRTYQLATAVNETNETDLTNFSRSYVRRMRAEVLLDAISQVTDTKNKFKGLPEGARAVQIADGNISNYFLRTFGRATRETVCSCEVSMEPNLGQALHLINGDNTGDRIKNGKLIETLLKEGVPPKQVIDKLYLRTLARRPTQAEKARLENELEQAGPDNAKTTLEDIFWALLNSKEFIFNH